ncbi:MAG: hypothetical protein C7B44_13655, partial [Sulfobacillus thermosulfidooxidans]
MSVLSVDHLKVQYGKKAPVFAVRDVSLEVQDQEFVGLVGESGCGKSTLGFAIARLERPPAKICGGQIIINGQDWTTMAEDRLR